MAATIKTTKPNVIAMSATLKTGNDRDRDEVGHLVRGRGEAIDHVGDSPADQEPKAHRRRARVRVEAHQHDDDRDDQGGDRRDDRPRAVDRK